MARGAVGRGARGAPRGVQRTRARLLGSRQGAALLLTPIIDMFVAIVFFLMTTFTVGETLVTVDPEIILPEAPGSEEATDQLRVGVSPAEITFGGETLMTLEEAMASRAADDPRLIAPLFQRLEEAYDEIQEVARAGGGAARGILAIQAHQDIPYAVLTRVMYTARSAGFQRFALHVVRPG